MIAILQIICYAMVIYLWSQVLVFNLLFKTKGSRLDTLTMSAGVIGGLLVWLISLMGS